MALRLHKKYGLNPTISRCPICGKTKNQIVLLGASYKEQAPMSMVTDLEPCERCKKRYLSKGVMMVEARKDMQGHVSPTGRIAVLRDRAFKRIFSKTEIPRKKIAFAEPGLLDVIGAFKKKKKKSII